MCNVCTNERILHNMKEENVYVTVAILCECQRAYTLCIPSKDVLRVRIRYVGLNSDRLTIAVISSHVISVVLNTTFKIYLLYF